MGEMAEFEGAWKGEECPRDWSKTTEPSQFCAVQIFFYRWMNDLSMIDPNIGLIEVRPTS